MSEAAEPAGPDPSEFLSGTLGSPGGRRGRLAARLGDRALDLTLVRARGWLDERFSTGGDEEEWLRRLHAVGGRVVYLAAAGIDHRRAGDDARLRSLMRSAYLRGRNMRAYDGMRGSAPPLARELRVLAGCGWHTARRGCPQGLIAGAHSAGRLVEAVRPR